MKKILYLSISLILVVLVSSCGAKRDAEMLTQKNQLLEKALLEKDSMINDVFASMNEIASNLNTIKSRENIVSTYVENGEVRKNSSVLINEDITAIDQLLENNRETIKRLESSMAQLKKSNIKIPALEALIKELRDQVEGKDFEIGKLKAEIGDMGVKVEELSSMVSDLNDQKIVLEDDVRTKTDILNTGYYIVGSQKELLDKGIVYKSGFIGKTLKINENRSLDNFTQVDIRRFDEIIIGKQDVRMISSHPEASYELVMKDKKTTSSIIILDKASFWKYSKVLVIIYK